MTHSDVDNWLWRNVTYPVKVLQAATLKAKEFQMISAIPCTQNSSLFFYLLLAYWLKISDSRSFKDSELNQVSLISELSLYVQVQ